MGSEQDISSFFSFWNPDAVSRAVGAAWVFVWGCSRAGCAVSSNAEAGSRVAERIYNAESHIETEG
jgi:hypothetical protein